MHSAFSGLGFKFLAPRFIVSTGRPETLRLNKPSRMIPFSEKWRQLRQSLTHTPQAVRFVWRTNRWGDHGIGFAHTRWRSVAGDTDLCGWESSLLTA